VSEPQYVNVAHFVFCVSCEALVRGSLYFWFWYAIYIHTYIHTYIHQRFRVFMNVRSALNIKLVCCWYPLYFNIFWTTVFPELSFLGWVGMCPYD
jgi:hypothetical protein